MELVFEIFGPQNREFYEQKFSCDGNGVSVIQDGPYRHLPKMYEYNAEDLWLNITYEVFELSSGLFDNAVLTAEDDTHTTEVANLGPANHQRVNIEPASCENSRNTREDPGFILDETIENMSRMPEGKGKSYCAKGAINRETHFLNGCKLGGGVL